MLTDRYRVVKALGDGTFGRVLLADDCCKGRQVAVKVIRNVEKYIKNAKREAEILKDIRDADTKKDVACVHMFESFTHESPEGQFFCLACEVLGESLYDHLKQNRFQGLWVQDIQSIVKQCLEALAFLHNDLGLTHTDLKLENVLFRAGGPPRPASFPRAALWRQARRGGGGRAAPYVRPASIQVKLIDFGNATYELEHHSSTINTRQYRAPEVILALGWNERSDLWSMGCILLELYTGELLFRTHESLEHLALMERTIEPFSASMLKKVDELRKDQFLVQDLEGDHWRLNWPEWASSPSSERRVSNQESLAKLVLQQHRSLAEFASSLLILEASRRPSASAALAHPFLFEQFPD
mmetsp:Transcript_71823/g.173986  ORF Transcript_71823/g.173986 Transcript_71823/m.173986 type:complete len:355 (+) Transcript_71823:531-1595(+)